MKNVQKIFLFFLISLMALIFIPNFSKATTTTVDTEENLVNAITNAEDNDIIQLTENINLNNPIEIVGKKLTIDGNGFTISKGENWQSNGSNATLITAGADTTLTLENIKLTNSEKYGVQSYNGAYVILNGVTISNCGFGGVLVNAGTVEVRDLTLNRNGSQSNNGIEIAKGYSVNTGNNQPTLIMNGKLSSTEKENVIFIAINDQLSEFVVSNGENAVNKIYTNGNKVVITDPNNNIIFQSNETDKQIGGQSFTKNINVTINLNDKETQFVVAEGTILTSEEVESKIDLASLELSNYKISGFYTSAEFTEEFDFTTAITTDTTIFAKLELAKTEKSKDVTPKTGIEDYAGLAILIIVASTISIASLNKKIMK